MPPDARPETVPTPETGRMLRRGTRPFAVADKGETLTVDVPSHESEGEGVAIGGDLEVVAYALRSLVETIGGVPTPTPTTIRRGRAKL